MKPISRGVFRAYDIRGIVDRDFDEQWVRTFGRAAGTYFRSKGWDRAVVGHDVRPSSSVYQAELAAGLCEAGVDVFLLGHTSTPLFYFAVRHLGCQAGIMVTASHNPPEYNGFKVWGGRTALAPQGIAELYETMAAGVFATGAGLASCHDILPAYVAELSQGMRLPRPVKVVLDGGNGSAGELTADFLELCGATVVRQYCDPDPTFPNHHPDPVVPANMVDLMARVPAEGAELGIGLDGDGDRIG
ncbi:MAG: phosphomannomutase, partial [Proteobacteria bacterium]|nr:phosphomannomutase [Pseudomonadota bacterium]